MPRARFALALALSAAPPFASACAPARDGAAPPAPVVVPSASSPPPRAPASASATAPGVSPPTAELEPFEDKDGSWGFKDAAGNVVVPPRYVMAQGFSPAGIAAVVDKQGWAMIDRSGRVLVRPFVIDNGPDEPSEGLARFVKGDRVGFFDETGRVVIDATYEHALPFAEGLAAVCRGCQKKAHGEHVELTGGTWGYVDKTGAVVIPLRFQRAEPFKGGVAKVRLANAERTIDRTGNVR